MRSGAKPGSPGLKEVTPAAGRRPGFAPETWFPSPVWARRVPDHERIIGNAVAGCATQLSFDFDRFELFFQEMWLNKNGPGDFNKAHVHPNSLLSGAYYAKVPEGSGNIEFYDPVRERVTAGLQNSRPARDQSAARRRPSMALNWRSASPI